MSSNEDVTIVNFDYSIVEFQKIYDKLNIKIVERGESFYQDRMKILVKRLEDKGRSD